MRALLVLLLLCSPALAQQPDESARLRDALRRTTQQLRAAQDAQAAAAAALAQAVAERDAARAELARAAATPAPTPAPAQAPPPPDPALAELRARAAALAAEATRATQAGQQAQAALTQQRARASQLAAVAEACVASNKAMAAVGEEVVTLYQNQHFRTLLVLSDDPILGLKRVEFENLLQNYQDRLRAGRYQESKP